MHFKHLLIVLSVVFIQKNVFSNSAVDTLASVNNLELCYTDSVDLIIQDVISKDEMRPNPLFQLFRLKQKKNKKITAALLAFPFPFGMVGLHRIYLGCAPYIPVVYIGTIGGVFGILPFIDFCILIIDKDLEKYNNNKNVFMWVE